MRYLVLILVLIVLGCGEKKSESKPEPIKVVTAKVQVKNIEEKFTLSGVAESKEIVQIRSRTEGFIVSKGFEDGGRVHKGSVLYKIDRATIEQTVDALKSQQQQNQIALDNASKNYDRYVELAKKDAVSKLELENAKSAYLQAKANYDATASNLKKSQFDLGFSTILSPIDGYADKSLQEIGAYVTSNTQLTTVYNNQESFINLGLDEYKHSMLSRARFTTNNISMQLQNCLPTIASGLVECKFVTKSSFRNNENVVVSMTIAKKALMLPQTALTQTLKGRAVFVKQQNKAIAKEVEVGSWIGDEIEVIKGLKEGDEIITDSARLKNGAEVQ